MAKKTNAKIADGVAIIGSSVAAIQTALTLAQMGIRVKVITELASLGWDGAVSGEQGNRVLDRRYLWPLLLRAMSHPLITLYSRAEVEHIGGEKGNFAVQVVQKPRYINEEICTGCNRCQSECSATVTSLLDGQKITHGAIHAPLIGGKAVPSAYVIDRNGFSPCHVGCPLGINVQGFISLLANGKTDKALALINESAPFSGILGRVCRHPCEDNCNREKVDSPVFIRALHRYVADNAPGGITYQRELPAGSRIGRIAIVGSGPAGLTAAWKLTRLGYSPTVFESHGVIGGMLATGIPRFRLPREVREREIKAIENLGVDIRAGITVGRDVTYAYLRERGYRAFFLSIGAQKNNRLKIPGEELEGVVDCMSLLLTLNLKVDTFVGSNIVVIGDGNSAIDSARAAIRRNQGTVSILSWTIPEEITALEEEVEEALQEGVKIEYCAVPVEILGEDGKVVGIRCQRTELSEEIMPNGRHRPVPIPGTDFIIDADHVVVAIGQSPNTTQLDIEGLAIDSDNGTIQVDPLTLETSVRGVFAGGDCITGPNNVVEAMAAGLRAAESIDRYLQDRRLDTGRSLEPPQMAVIDLSMVDAFPYKRANMPVIRSNKRINSYEETTTGLSEAVAQQEAQRCINCALCSQCMECTRVCELGAVFHDDDIKRFDVGAKTVLKFADDSECDAFTGSGQANADGIHTVVPKSGGELTGQISEAMAVAMETALEVELPKASENQAQDFALNDTDSAHSLSALEQSVGSRRIGVFLCNCGGSISSVINFKAVVRKLSYIPAVSCIKEIAQACTEEGAQQIANQVAESQLDCVVLAACRCCNLEQVCYSCTDRRSMCQQHLNKYLDGNQNTVVEFVNIREQCAWSHKDDPRGANRKALQIITTGIVRSMITTPMALGEKSILPSVLVVDGKLVGLVAARALASRGYHVEFAARQVSGQKPYNPDEEIPQIFRQLQERDLIVKPWPDSLNLNGCPGNYEAVLEYGSQTECVNVGAVLVDMDELEPEKYSSGNTNSVTGLLERIISRRKNSDYNITDDGDLLRRVTITETNGLFMLPSVGTDLPDEQVRAGLSTAARVSAYLEQASIDTRAMSVNINSKLCRACGDCMKICPYIEMRERGDGTVYAYIDKALCLGCGACIPGCPTGAISQGQQSDKHIVSTLRAMIHPGHILSEVG